MTPAHGPPAGDPIPNNRTPQVPQRTRLDPDGGTPQGSSSPDRRQEPDPSRRADDLLDRSDAELLTAHVAGDRHAFGVLVARHRNRLWAVALRMMRNPDDAADALQDAYMSAFRRAGSFRGEAAVTTWLHRVTVNACLDRLRRMASHATHPLPDDPERLGQLDAPGPTELLEAEERHRLVVDALAQINPDQRAALILVDMEGYSVDEAAQILSCAVGTVKSRCARGRARLLPLLTDLTGPGRGS